MGIISCPTGLTYIIWLQNCCEIQVERNRWMWAGAVRSVSPWASTKHLIVSSCIQWCMASSYTSLCLNHLLCSILVNATNSHIKIECSRSKSRSFVCHHTFKEPFLICVDTKETHLIYYKGFSSAVLCECCLCYDVSKRFMQLFVDEVLHLRP